MKLNNILAHRLIINCDPHRIPATKAEELVWNDIEQVFSGNLSEELLLAGGTHLVEKILKLKDDESDKEISTDATSYNKLLDVLRDLKVNGITTVKKQKIVTSLIERIEIHSFFTLDGVFTASTQ